MSSTLSRSSGILLLGAAVLCAGMIGCSSQKQTFPVEGTVFYDDGKLASDLFGGTVQFEAVDAKIYAEGTIGPNGRFKLTTYKAGDGAIAGKHRVAVFPPDLYDASKGPVLDPSFEDPQKSGIVRTVEPGENKFNIIVSRPRP